MRLLSWNVNGRNSCMADQVFGLAERCPDVIALQEVKPASVVPLATAFAAVGFPHVVDSFALAPPDFTPGGPRSYGLLVASRAPLETIPPGRFDVPWPERIPSVRVMAVTGAFELHTTHIPPGSSNGWIKVDMLRGLYAGLARSSALPRVLCGDFNTPQAERFPAEVITWAQRIGRDGSVRLCAKVRGRPGVLWDAAERDMLVGLAAFDLADVFRAIHGYGTHAFS
jgi:exonuclease III